MAANGELIFKRYQQMKSARLLHEQRWEMHAPYMSPWSYGPQNPDFLIDGEATQTQVYDSTAIHSNDVLANFVSGEVINPAEKYLYYRHADPALDEQDEIKEFLEECTTRVLAEMSASNFYSEAPAMIAGVTGFGTGSLFRGERLKAAHERESRPGWRGFRFKNDKIGRFLVAENPNGEIDTCYREFSYSADQCNRRWTKLPQKVREAVSANKLEERFWFIHAVEPRESSQRHGYGGPSMAWKSCYVEKDSKEVVEEGGFKRFPFVNPRWDIIPGEVYGRCPGDIAFNHILTLNTATRLDMEAWALDARPPVFAANDSVMGTVDLQPGQFMTTRMNPRTTRLQDNFFQYTSGAQHQVNDVREAKQVQAIRLAYHVDELIAVMAQPKTEETATQFIERLNLMFRILGAVYGRFYNEFLKPFFDDVFLEMYQARRFPPLPPLLADAVEQGNDIINVEFNNPLHRAQKSSEAAAIRMTMVDLTPVIEREMQVKGYSDAWERVDPEKTAKKIFDIHGFPAICARSDKEMAEIKQARAEAQAQQRQQQEAAMVAESMGKAAPALKLLQGGQGGA